MASKTKHWVGNLPVAAQQSFKLISEKELWPAKNNEELSIKFEELMDLPNFSELMSNSANEEGILSIIDLIAYLRIEQAVYFIEVMPAEVRVKLLEKVRIKEPEINEVLNLQSRLDTLSKLHMLDRIFSDDRRELIMSVLSSD